MTTAYAGSLCKAAGFELEANVQRPTAAGDPLQGGVKNKSTTATIEIMCPIVKYTSGPGISLDAVYSVAMDVVTSQTVSCQETSYTTHLDALSAPNAMMSWGNSVTSSGTLFMSSAHYATTDYWDGGGQGTADPPSWYYSDIHCTLPPGSGIRSYNVQELGDLQPNRIYSSASCSSDVSNTKSWFAAYNVATGTGGYIYSTAYGGAAFVMDCPVPSGTSVEFGVLPAGTAGGDQRVGCILDSNNLPAMPWSAPYVPPDMKHQVIPSGSEPIMAIPAAGTGHQLVCGHKEMTNKNGDSSLLSYRGEPALTRNMAGSVWAATASSTNGSYPLSNALDGDTNSRWSSGVPMANNQYFQVDLKAAKTFRRLTFNSGVATDYARGYQVYLSNDAMNWGSPVATGTGSAPLISVRFFDNTTQKYVSRSARYVKIVQTGSSSYWWSIADFNLYW